MATNQYGTGYVNAPCGWFGCAERAPSRDKLCSRHRAIVAGNRHAERQPGGPKLDDEQRADVIRRMRAFESPKAIAALYGINVGSVTRIMNQSRK